MRLNTLLTHFNATVGLHSEEFPWQWPAATEHFYFVNHFFRQSPQLSSELYVGIPWATLIDSSFNQPGIFEEFKRSPIFADLKKIIKTQTGATHTVCQHIQWKKLISIWEELNITHVHLCHFEKTLGVDSNLIFKSWPLLATNHEAPARRTGLKITTHREKKYLASFIGAHCENYRSDIRLKLKEMADSYNRSDVLFELSSEWFYQGLVYENQINRQPITESDLADLMKRTKTYNEVLSDSVFSLCPEGSGPNTIRLWESLAVGAIPVVYSDQWVPPELKELNWKDFSIFIPQNDYKMTWDILKSLNSETIDRMQINCLNAYNQFSKFRCF